MVAKAACKSPTVIFSPFTIASNVLGLSILEVEDVFPAEVPTEVEVPIADALSAQEKDTDPTSAVESKTNVGIVNRINRMDIKTLKPLTESIFVIMKRLNSFRQALNFIIEFSLSIMLTPSSFYSKYLLYFCALLVVCTKDIL